MPLALTVALALATHPFLHDDSQVDAVDYREFVVCLRILENFKDIPNKARTLMLRFYDIWSTPTGTIPRASALKMVAIAAETDQEIYATRGLFDEAITKVARHYGLKPRSVAHCCPTRLPRLH